MNPARYALLLFLGLVQLVLEGRGTLAPLRGEERELAERRALERRAGHAATTRRMVGEDRVAVAESAANLPGVPQSVPRRQAKALLNYAQALSARGLRLDTREVQQVMHDLSLEEAAQLVQWVHDEQAGRWVIQSVVPVGERPCSRVLAAEIAPVGVEGGEG